MKISKEIKAGAIAVLAIVGFVLMFQFMKGRSIFSSENVFHAKYDNVDGLEASSPVTIKGLKVGQVSKIEPKTTPDGKIYFDVSMLVDKKFSFSRQSTVEIYETGLMSGKALRINPVYGNPLAENGDTLQGLYKSSMLEGLSSQVGPVKDQLQSVLKRVDSLANNATKILDEKNRAEIKQLLLNLNRTVASLEGTSNNASALINNNDAKIQSVLESANKTMISANSAVGKYGNLAESIDTKKLNATVANLDATVSNLNNVIATINRGEGSLGKLTKDEQLYNNLEQTTKNLNELVQDMKTNPKRYLNISVFGKNNKD